MVLVKKLFKITRIIIAINVIILILQQREYYSWNNGPIKASERYSEQVSIVILAAPAG